MFLNSLSKNVKHDKRYFPIIEINKTTGEEDVNSNTVNFHRKEYGFEFKASLSLLLNEEPLLANVSGTIIAAADVQLKKAVGSYKLQNVSITDKSIDNFIDNSFLLSHLSSQDKILLKYFLESIIKSQNFCFIKDDALGLVLGYLPEEHDADLNNTISRLDYFASLAMQGLISGSKWPFELDSEQVTNKAVEFANTLLKAIDKDT